MEDMDFFDRFGDVSLFKFTIVSPTSREDKGSVSVDDMYQAFKQRLLTEVSKAWEDSCNPEHNVATVATNTIKLLLGETK